MTHKPYFAPTAENMFVITYPEEGVEANYNFPVLLSRSQKCEREGRMEEACNLRYEGVKHLMELIPDEDEVWLDWEESENQPVLELLQRSAIDHFLVGDFEMAAGMLEMLLDLDPEDHLEGTKTLAYCYVALEDYELFDEVINDISDKYAEKEILKLWSDFRRMGTLPAGELIYFRKNFPFFYAEFTADAHPVTPEYLQEIEGDRPSRSALARELWLQTEHLWVLFPGFLEALRMQSA
ncbi:MAG: tetratricopeptide repeat protein [Alistipes sp.]|nr:tetratricopeptide repeat protein [Alistipes sp.]